MTKAIAWRFLSRAASAAAISTAIGVALLAQAPEPARGVKFARVDVDEMKAWLGYLASDELQGRQVFTEGYGLAASYVADQLTAWRVKPLGDAGTYFQGVRLRGYRATRNSTVTVTAPNGTTTTFKHGDHVTFNAGPGGSRTLTFTGAEFVGYGQVAEVQSRAVADKLVVWVPNLAAAAGRGGRGGAGAAINTYRAAAAIGFAPAPAQPTEAERALTQAREALQKATEAVQQAQAEVQGRGRGRGAAAGGRGAATPPDFTTVLKVDAPMPPQIMGDEVFFEALFAGSPTTFADVRAKAQKGEPLPPLSLPVRVTINVDNTFEPVSEQRTRNVVGMIEGTDPVLKSTYVVFGAHLDHVGYSQTGAGALPTPTSCRSRSEAAQAAVKAAGKVVQNPGRGRGAGAPTGAAPPPAPARPPFDARDHINNGADDDASGSTAVLAIAKAFATGPRPKRSVVFVWHAGEEAGLYGSRSNADFPVVPLDQVQAVLNMDMVGRDDCNNLEGDYTDSVFVVGADRISTDLHNVIVKTNAAQAKPMTLDYELNDPLDPENIYTRSDHYSYAAKGIPITFFTTGLHPDYHKVTDTADKIVFPKLARIAQLVYESGFAIANSDRALRRDNRGPRTGFGSRAEVLAD